MKKILIIVPDLDIGGVTTSVVNFCNELIKRGHEVSLLNMDRSDNIKGLSIDLSVKRIRLKGIAQYWNLGIDDVRQANNIKKIGLLMLGLLKKITNHSTNWMKIVFQNSHQETEYDVAVAFKQCSPCYYYALNYVRATKKIAFIHGDILSMGDISSWTCYFPAFDFVACVSDAVRKGYEKRYEGLKHKFCTVYNMFDVSTTRAKAKQTSQVKIDCSIVNIVTVARNENSEKQIDMIPQICAALKESNSKRFHWYVIGDGPDLENNKRLAVELGTTDVLTFCGALWNPYPILGACDFLVLPSKWEAYGMVVVEAHILHKPVVATNYPALSEILEDGVTGLISEPNIVDLFDNVRRMVENEDEILFRMKENLQQYEVTNDLAYSQFVKLL